MNEEERSRASSRPRILVVDDSESLCRTLTLILERDGYGTETAGTGREALDKAHASFFNVALLDIKLPDMEGAGLLAPLKELHPDMALIMVTAHASVETAVRALNEGASAYIIKPLNMDEVLAQVRKALEKQRLVTEKRQAEEALQASEEQLQQIMDTVPEGVLLLDADRRISLANPAAQAYLPVLTDAEAGEALTHLGGWPIDEVLKPPQEGLRHELLVDAPTPRVFEVASRAMGAGHEASGWILLLRDVTAERHVRQRVEDQERLAALGQMAAGIAHDFNNIMAVIVLYAQMLPRTQELLPRNRERLETICQQAKRATNLVQQILDFSRASILERQPLNLFPFLKEQLKLLERTLPENIRLDLACGHDEYMVDADSTRMQQVFMNLVLNARDAMPEGGDLRIELARLRTEPGVRYPLPDMEPGQWVRVTVSDTGTGIPPEVKPHIFEPFFTTKARGQGTGLGLPQVYGIIKQHEGYIGLDTEVGQGTTFTLYLPAVVAPQEETMVRPPAVLVEGSGETILVVEDEPATRQALVDGLEMLNYRALAAANGDEALAIFEQHEDEIGLVLSDWVMPGRGGAELFQALKQRNPALKMKMVILTGYPLGEETVELRTQGIVDWVQKPIDVDELAEVVQRALSGTDPGK